MLDRSLGQLGDVERSFEPTKSLSPFCGIVSGDNAMVNIFETIRKVASSTSTVLILGESGTGKELIARAIHETSKSKGAFIPVNCGAIPDSLLESELFGHEKGAFTGAINSKPGRFVLADGGTIFLDEIGEMSPHLQVKLLRVLQERVVESVGGVRPRPVNVRVIAATNVNLWEQVHSGVFREDLFYRLQVVPIHLPPLRERPADVAPLIKHFVRDSGERTGQPALSFTPRAMTALINYPWPGNVRELQNLIERLTVLSDRSEVDVLDLPEHIREPLPQRRCQSVPTLPAHGVDFNTVVEQFENSLILQALERTRWNKKAAARLLNLNRTTLVEKIKKKQLDDNERPNPEPQPGSPFPRASH